MGAIGSRSGKEGVSSTGENIPQENFDIPVRSAPRCTKSESASAVVSFVSIILDIVAAAVEVIVSRTVAVAIAGPVRVMRVTTMMPVMIAVTSGRRRQEEVDLANVIMVAWRLVVVIGGYVI